MVDEKTDVSAKEQNPLRRQTSVPKNTDAKTKELTSDFWKKQFGQKEEMVKWDK